MNNALAHITHPVCRICGGDCCKRYPGLCHPDDFNKPLIRTLADALASGNYYIDYWYGDIRGRKRNAWRNTYYVRPSMRYETDLAESGDYDGRHCTFLTPAGCLLPYHRRPRECCGVIPDLFMQNCTEIHDKEHYIKAWIPYQGLLIHLGAERG